MQNVNIDGIGNIDIVKELFSQILKSCLPDRDNSTGSK